MPLTLDAHQGLHGEGYVFAMACTAGLLASRPILDADGIDWTIGHPGALGSVRSPKIEIQVKTARRASSDDDAWTHRLSVPHFNALAGSGFAIRRYFVLVTVPSDTKEYAMCDPGGMSLRHAAYWTSLSDRSVLPVGAEEQKTVAVRVPKANLLTPATLLALVAGDIESDIR